MSELPVRVGTPEDLDEIMNLSSLAWEEMGFVEPSAERFLSELWPALNMEKGMVGIIGSVGKPIEGAVLLRVGSMWYSDKPVLEEKAVFIHPDFRSIKGGRASRLCEFSKKAAEELGMPLVIGIISNSRTEAKVRMYRRKFGEPFGAFFLYNAGTGNWSQQAAE
jgi:hypothetical protein